MAKYDNINIAQEQAKVEDMKKRKKYLAMHKNKIYQGSDGLWYTYLPTEPKRTKVKKKTEEEVEDRVIKFFEELETNPTLDELFEEWITQRYERNKIARSTYDRTWQVYRRHFEEFGKNKISTLTPEDFEDFLEEELAEKQLTSKSFSSLKSVVKGILQRGKRLKVVNFNVKDLFDDLDIADRDFHKTVKEDSEEVFDEEETAKIIEYCMSDMTLRNTAVLLMFVSGLRVGELVALKHEDIAGPVVSVRRTETKYSNPDGPGYIYGVKDFPKTQAGIRNVVIPKDFHFVLSRLRVFNAFGDYIFVENGVRLNTQKIRRHLLRVCNNVGIPPRSPHKIRKTVTSILMDAKLDNNLIKSQMGWTDIAVGENFYHRNRKSIDKKLDIISSIGEFQLSSQ